MGPGRVAEAIALLDHGDVRRVLPRRGRVGGKALRHGARQGCGSHCDAGSRGREKGIDPRGPDEQGSHYAAGPGRDNPPILPVSDCLWKQFFVCVIMVQI